MTVPTATPTGPIDFGGSVNFSTVASGGVGPYALTWQNLPTGCLSVNASTINCVPSTSGSWPVSVTVTDAAGGASTSGAVTFIVNGVLTVGSIASTPLALDLGQSVTFYAVGVSGGDGVYGYTWSGLPAGCPAVNASSVTCAPSQTGSFTPNLNVSDSAGARARASCPFRGFLRPLGDGRRRHRAGART